MVKVSFIFLFFLFSLNLFGDGNDTYKDVSGLFGIESNAGLNSFLSLLIPSGGKFEGMGSAYTAMALDGGYLEANPAAGSLISKTELAFTHNDWIADSALEGAYYTFRPKKLVDMGLGFSTRFFHIPLTGYNPWGGREINDTNGSYAAGWYSEFVGTANISYNFLRSYYFSGIALGASLKVGYRGVADALQPGQNSLALMGDVGVMTRFNLFKAYISEENNFALGVALQNLGAEFVVDPDPLPTLLKTGISYKPIRPLTFAVDVNVPFNLNGTPSEDVYGAFGFNVVAASFLSVHGGIMLKKSKPRFTVGADLSLKSFSLVTNYTFDLATQFSFFDRMSIAIKIDIDMVKHLLQKDEVQKLYLDGLEYYARGELLEAVSKWEMCLSIDPKFNPAKEMLATARKTLELWGNITDTLGIDGN